MRSVPLGVPLNRSYSTSSMERVRERLQVDEVGSRRPSSLLKRITRSVGNPSGGIESAPVINARMFDR